METVLGILGAIAFVVMAGEKLEKPAARLRIWLTARRSKNLAEYHHKQVMAAIDKLGSELVFQRKGPLEASLDLGPVIVEMAEVKALLEKMSGPDAVAQADLYTKALGSLANGQSAILEAVGEVKENQGKLIAVLNNLTLNRS